MRLASTSLIAVALAFAAPAAPAFAQTAGTQVVDTSGAAVGTVIRVDGENIIIKTDKHEVALPKTSFTPDKGKLLFGMTQAQLNAATEKSLAEAAAAIAPGATVKGSGGTVVGTIDAVDTETVTIKLGSGSLVRVPKTGVAAGNGEVVVGLTAQELEAGAAPSAGGQ
jgi:preprotein translocase subunit YajC